MDLDPLAVVRRRLRAQRLTGSHAKSPAEAVAWLGAVQGQEWAEAKWSVAERTRGAITDADVEAALDRGELLRTHVLRPTWHLATPDDLRWLLELTGPRVLAGNRGRERQLGLDDAELERADDLLGGAVSGGAYATRDELAEMLRARGIATDGQRMPYLLMHAELRLRLCSGPRRGRQHTYAAFDERVPKARAQPREVLLEELAVRYFSSRGPATAKDLATWSGLTLTDVRAGIARAAERLRRETAADATPWFVAAGAAPRASPSAPKALLLPVYDEMIMGYIGLRVVPGPSPLQPTGFDRTVAVDGRTIGTWRRTLSAKEVVVEITLRTGEGRTVPDAVQETVARFGRFLGRPARAVLAC